MKVPMWVRWVAFALLFALVGGISTPGIPWWGGSIIGAVVGTFVLWFGFDPETPCGQEEPPDDSADPEDS